MPSIVPLTVSTMREISLDIKWVDGALPDQSYGTRRVRDNKLIIEEKNLEVTQLYTFHDYKALLAKEARRVQDAPSWYGLREEETWRGESTPSSKRVDIVIMSHHLYLAIKHGLASC